MREKLKFVSNRILKFLGNAALSFAATCATLRNSGLDVAEESKNQDDQLTDVSPTPSTKEVVANVSQTKDVTGVMPMSELPVSLYTAEYFTVPQELRSYPALVQAYRSELLLRIQQTMNCETFKTQYVLESIEYYLALLTSGQKPDYFKGQTNWPEAYMRMAGIVAAQNRVPLAERADMVGRLINNLEDAPSTLDNNRELLAVMRETGRLPSNAPIALLDLLSFVNLPTYLKNRVERYNVSFNSKMEIRGEFYIN